MSRVQLNVPWGWWDSRGVWHPNVHINLSPDEQKSQNEAAGFDCTTTPRYDAFSRPMPKRERQRIDRESPRCPCGNIRSHDNPKCRTCLDADERAAVMLEAAQRWEERQAEQKRARQKQVDTLHADIIAANSLEELRDVVLRIFHRLESER